MTRRSYDPVNFNIAVRRGIVRVGLLVLVFFLSAPGFAQGQAGWPPIIGGQFRPLTKLRGDVVCVAYPLSQASRPDDIQKMIQELEALPVSRDRAFYRQALRQRGFRIVDSQTTNNQTRFEADKNNRRIALEVQFDRDTGKSTNVDVASLRDTQSVTQEDSLSMSQDRESR
jgi:hypothetical protein